MRARTRARPRVLSIPTPDRPPLRLLCYNLRELFYDRNPGDARVKVGSERQAASSPTGPSFGVAEIGYSSRAFCPRGPSKIGASMRRFTPKKLLGGTWAKRALSASLLGGTLASRNYAYNLIPSCSRQLRSDPWFSSRQFSSCLLYTSPSPRDMRRSRMPSSA